MLTFRFLLLGSIALAASAAGFGCYTGSPIDTNRPANGETTPTVSTDGTNPASTDGDNGEGGASKNQVDAPTGIPCDVATVLKACTTCHGASPSHGAPNRLLSYDDLASKSDDDPTQTVAQISLARMKSVKRPMPPDGNLADDQLAIFAKWIDDGLPKGTCGEPAATTPDGGKSTTPPKDGGSSGSIDASAPSVCTSKSFYAADAGVGEEMHPGKACLACHAATGAKSFFIAGTVFPTIHEPDDCNGSSTPNTSIVLIDATGVTHTIAVNDVGNFSRVTSFPLPYRAMVVHGTSVREMHTPQTDGDCNGCHSEWGTKSPGRVMAP